MTLLARSTPIGTLELFCVARDGGGNRWRLEFNLRELVKDSGPREADEARDETVSEVWEEEKVQAAAQALRATFATFTLPPTELPKALETALEASRSNWPTSLCRRLWDFLAETAEGRRKSPAHLTRWFNLAGHCLRPGFGDSLDKFRIENLWKLLATPQRVAGTVTAKAVEGGADQWILWRRVAGGLNAGLQQALFERLRPHLIPGKNKPGYKPAVNELVEMWRAAASLERLAVAHKQALGEVLLAQLRRPPLPPYLLWSLTRLGARRLVYGPLNAVLHPQIVEGWLEALLPLEPTSESDRLAWLFCLAQLARRTGQRALDISESLQHRVLDQLRQHQASEPLLAMVETVTESHAEEQGQLLGDTLPIGLRLVTPTE